MSFQDHTDIIGTITDWKSCFGGESISDHLNDVGLLFWWYPTSQNNIYHITTFQEEIFVIVSFIDLEQWSSSNNYGLFPLSEILILLKEFIVKFSKLTEEITIERVDDVLVHIVI